MSKLKPDYREVLLLRFVEGYGAADVGRMTGRSEGAVRTLQHRAIDRLRKELDRMGELSLFERFSGADAAERCRNPSPAHSVASKARAWTTSPPARSASGSGT